MSADVGDAMLSRHNESRPFPHGIENPILYLSLLEMKNRVQKNTLKQTGDAPFPLPRLETRGEGERGARARFVAICVSQCLLVSCNMEGKSGCW